MLKTKTDRKYPSGLVIKEEVRKRKLKIKCCSAALKFQDTVHTFLTLHGQIANTEL